MQQKGAAISVRGANEAWLFVDGQLVLDHGGPGYKSSMVRVLGASNLAVGAACFYRSARNSQGCADGRAC